MSISSQRFAEEWDNYKRNNGKRSVESIISQITQKKYCREAISRYKNDVRPLQEEDFEIFANLFQIRKEYLAGIDNCRTIEDFERWEQTQCSISNGLRQIIMALGYADSSICQEDINPTFPENTYYFLNDLKDDLLEKNISLVCDVNADKYVPLQTDIYKEMLQDIVDYTKYKFQKLFEDADTIPTAIFEDGTSKRHPKTTFQLTNNKSVTIQQTYKPNAEYDSQTYRNSFSVYENK